jgi:gephyrin
MTSVVAHGLKQLQGGSGEDVHPPRESVKQSNVTAHTASAGLDNVHDPALKGYPSESAGCGHHHRHHHHHEARSKDPSTAVSGRLRQSPFPMISLKEALDIVDANSTPLPTEQVPTGHKLRNHVLAEDVFAATDLPMSMTTNVDGYAVAAEVYNRAARSVDSSDGLVVRVVKAGESLAESDGGKVSVVRINTGGPLPPGADSVIMVEDTELVSGKQFFHCSDD